MTRSNAALLGGAIVVGSVASARRAAVARGEGGRRRRVSRPTVAGRLTIRGITQSVSTPAHVEFALALSARGRFSVKQTDSGIKPISVGGVVAVKNALFRSTTFPVSLPELSLCLARQSPAR